MATSAISGRSVTGREIHPPLADSSTGPLRRDAVRPRCGSDGNRSHLFGDFAAQHRAERMRQCTRDRRHASRSLNAPNRTASRASTRLPGLWPNGSSRCEILPALRVTTALSGLLVIHGWILSCRWTVDYAVQGKLNKRNGGTEEEKMQRNSGKTKKRK